MVSEHGRPDSCSVHAALGSERFKEIRKCSRWRCGQRLYRSTSYPCSRIDRIVESDSTRNYQHAIRILAAPISSVPFSAPATDSLPLARFEKGITFEGNLYSQDSLDVLNLFFGNPLIPARRFPQIKPRLRCAAPGAVSSAHIPAGQKRSRGTREISTTFCRSLHSRTGSKAAEM